MDVYGPPLPPGFKLNTDEDSESESEKPYKKTKFFGPQCPSFLTHEQSNKISDSTECRDKSMNKEIIGPVLPSSQKKNKSDDDDEEEEVYGPMPSQTEMDYDIVNMIEKRASNMKDKLNKKDIPSIKSIQREEWMVVPDTSRRNQLGAISRCLAPSSRTSRKEETHSCDSSVNDIKTTEELKKYNKSKRGESLLEMHREKKKKDKEKKSKHKERKAFDREEIAVRHFTKKQVNSVIDKAKYLNSRFAPGRSQYL